MSYYILPKNINKLNIEPCSSTNESDVYILYSLLKYYNELKENINENFIDDFSNNSFENAIKIIHPYEFIFTKVPGTKLSVSKLKLKTNIFYDLLEICKNLNIFDEIKLNKISFLHLTTKYVDTIECFEIFRDGFKDLHCFFDSLDYYKLNINNKIFDFMFFEIEYSNDENYFIHFIKTIMNILNNQKNNGISIIKISHIFHKPIIDGLYLLSSLFDKVYVCKPSSNNIILFDKYIVCKNFLSNNTTATKQYLKIIFLKFLVFLEKLGDKKIKSLFNFDIPCYFKNKIIDINLIIGQQQLDALEQIITIYKNKNKSNKIEIIKKNSIQKSIIWCEKYKIPCNKFVDKTNTYI